jgi:hypothetical protein
MAQNGSDKGKKVYHSGEIGISGKRVVFKIISGKASRIYSLLQEHGRTWQTKSAPVWRLGHNEGKTTSSPGAIGNDTAGGTKEKLCLRGHL